MVNWQKTDYHRCLEARERETGLTVADVNRMNNPNGVHSTAGYVAMGLSQGSPSIFMTVVSKVTGGSFGGGSSSAVESDAITAANAEQIKADIQAIYDKYKEQGVTNISDLEAYLQSRCDEADTNIKTLEKNIKTNNEVIEDKTKRNKKIDTRLGELNTLLGTGEGSITAQINSIDTQIQEAKNNGKDTIKLEAEKKELTAKKQQLETEKKDLEKEKSDNTNEIIKAQNSLGVDKPLLTEFQVIQNDIEDLKTLSKQLKKAEGRDAIESLTNDDTANITNLIKKMNNAQITGNKDKEAKCKKELEEALKEYVKNPDNKNKTILKYAETFGIK